MVEGELLQMEKLGKLITLNEHFDLIFPQDRVPVFSLHATGRNSRRRYSRARSGSGPVWARPRHGVPDRSMMFWT